MQRDPVGRDEAGQRDEDDEDGVEPVDVLVPVAPGHGLVGDMDLLGVVLGAGSQRHIVGCAVWEGGRRGLCGRGRWLGHCCVSLLFALWGLKERRWEVGG